MIKEKKHAVAEAEMQIKQLDHDLQVLGKDRTAAVNQAANLEKQFEWIAETKE